MRILRDRRWLLEGDGRFFDCRKSRIGDGCSDVTDSGDPEIRAAHQRLEDLLRKLPAPSLEPDPYLEEQKKLVPGLRRAVSRNRPR